MPNTINLIHLYCSDAVKTIFREKLFGEDFLDQSPNKNNTWNVTAIFASGKFLKFPLDS